MAKNGKVKRVQDLAIAFLSGMPDGMRYRELVGIIRNNNKFKDVKPNTIGTTVSELDKDRPKEVAKVARGVFQHIKFLTTLPPAKPASKKESDFYGPFARWLVEEVEDCTEAVPLGGNKFGGKWGTPDVVGCWKSSQTDPVKIPTEIVTAEIKSDSNNLITAFGQACSYKLFSNVVYLVIPSASSEEDKARLDALCQIHGIGLVYFDANNAKDPKFDIRVRPVRHEPDMFYVNDNMKKLDKLLIF